MVGDFLDRAGLELALDEEGLEHAVVGLVEQAHGFGREEAAREVVAGAAERARHVAEAHVLGQGWLPGVDGRLQVGAVDAGVGEHLGHFDAAGAEGGLRFGQHGVVDAGARRVGRVGHGRRRHGLRRFGRGRGRRFGAGRVGRGGLRGGGVGRRGRFGRSGGGFRACRGRLGGGGRRFGGRRGGGRGGFVGGRLAAGRQAKDQHQGKKTLHCGRAPGEGCPARPRPAGQSSTGRRPAPPVAKAQPCGAAASGVSVAGAASAPSAAGAASAGAGAGAGAAAASATASALGASAMLCRPSM